MYTETATGATETDISASLTDTGQYGTAAQVLQSIRPELQAPISANQT